MTDGPSLTTEHDFYCSDTRGLARSISPEVDFGNDWRGADGSLYRLTYVDDTRELYVIGVGGPADGLLWVVAEDLTEQEAEDTLPGWRDHYDPQWAIGRLSGFRNDVLNQELLRFQG